VPSIARHVLSRLTYANVAATLALTIAAGGATAYAAGRAPSDGVQLCAAKKTGDLRLAKPGKCQPGEKAVALPAGPQGAAGAVGATGATGAIGATGPAGTPGTLGERGERGPQGERGEQGEQGAPGSPATALVSPNERYSITPTDKGIVLAGPNGSVTFDGATFSSTGGLTLSATGALTLNSGTTWSATSGTDMTIKSLGRINETSTTTWNQTVGSHLTQSVSSNYSQSVGSNFTQSIGQNAARTVGNDSSDTVNGAFMLFGYSISLGRSGTCLLAARAGSQVSANKVTEVGGATSVWVC
jgi:hypothetical protein